MSIQDDMDDKRAMLIFLGDARIAVQHASIAFERIENEEVKVEAAHLLNNCLDEMAKHKLDNIPAPSSTEAKKEGSHD